MDEREENEPVSKAEQPLEPENESKDVETPVTKGDPDVSSPTGNGNEGTKSDVALKFATDEENATEKSCSGTSKILCFVIGFLVVVAVVITAVLLSYDGQKSEPAAVIPPTPSPPTSSGNSGSAPVATPPASPGATPSPTQLASSSPTAFPTASPTIDLTAKVVDFLASNQVVVNEMNPSAKLAVAVLANETSGVLDTTSAPKIIQRFALLTVDFAIRAASNTSDIPISGTMAPVDENSTATTVPGTTTSAPVDGNATAAPVDGNSTGGFFQVNTTDPGAGTAAPGAGTGNPGAGTGGTFFTPASTPGAFGGFRNLQTNVDDECLWTGVTCLDGVVTDLNFYGQQLQGTIPTEIGLLADLKHIDLSQNELKGTIPEEIYQLTKMEELFLHHNQLSGTISDSVGNWWNLTHLHLSHNQLSGTIPATMASGSDIRPYYVINLKNNKLTGTIPSNLRWRQLSYFDLGSNQLTGTLPDDLGQTFIRLRHLFLDNNQFVGTLPDSYINVGNGRLEQFAINNNQLTGTIPSDHTQFNYLNLYLLDGNNFSSMSENTCRLSVIIGGENVEFSVNCNICNCQDGFFCRNC